MKPIALSLGTTALVLLLLPAEAAAQTEFDYRGLVESDLRLAIPGPDDPEGVPDVYFARSDNTVRVTAALRWMNVQAVADLAVFFSGRPASGRPEIDEFQDLHYRAEVDPWYFESDALYVEIYDFILDGVDLKLGRQIVDWGKADIFNPTSVVNPYDLEDPLDFGRKIANEMVVLSINPPWYVDGEEIPIVDEINLTLVAVPIFRSQLLPQSAGYAFTSPEQFGRFVNSDLLGGLVEVQKFFIEERDGIVNYDLSVEEPSVDIENIQLGSRAGISLFGIDLSAIYYYGFDHNVQPKKVTVSELQLTNGMTFPYPEDLSDPDMLIGQLVAFEEAFGISFAGASVDTDILLAYPRVHVVGGSAATSLDFLGGLGIWAEFAATIHDGVPLDLTLGDRGTCGTTGPDGEPITEDCIEQEYQVQPGWFWKLTTGLDYSITSWWYTNIQYVHGFVDEFGTENLGDYIVAGMDFKAFSEQLLIRIFTIWQLTEAGNDVDDMSAILYPALTFDFWQNLDLIAGALLHIGEPDTKFGNRVTGPNFVFLKGRYTF